MCPYSSHFSVVSADNYWTGGRGQWVEPEGEQGVVCDNGGIPGERWRILEGTPSIEPLPHSTLLRLVRHLRHGTCYIAEFAVT